ncbi:hypothetical protein [Mycobacterium hubeiense]|uniref:hypothetical protein n=1 Tax=Mycobacterium hubeiense TaxID=1867256 RepID=UPI000C7E91CD|nr:hypothetical protein [Mycobacterium sp. QGD 101]
MAQTDENRTISRAEHLQKVRSAVDAVAAYAVDGSPEALLADAVRHLTAAVSQPRTTAEPGPFTDPFARAILAAIVHKNGGSLEITLDELLDAGNPTLTAHYDERRRLYRIESASVPDKP